MKRVALLLLSLCSPPLLPAQQSPPAPEVYLSANAGQTGLFTGWPLILHLTIMNSNQLNPSADPSPLVVAPPNAPWTDAISFTVLTSTGSTAHWPFQLVGTPSDAVLELTAGSYVRLAWQISAAEVSALPPGDYQLSATIHVSNSSGWNGTVQSEPVSLTVVPEPTLTADQSAEKTFQLSEFAVNNNDFVTAVTATQTLRLSQPNNPEAAIVAAQVLNVAGYPELALVQASNAVDTFYRVNPTPDEAPSSLLGSYQSLLTALTVPDQAAQTFTSVASQSIPFSPTAQTLSLTASVSSVGGAVDGGTVTFTIPGINGSATSLPLNGNTAGASFTVPGGTHAGTFPIQGAFSGTSAFSPSTDASASLKISQATPALKWNNPADISLGTALGASQLNATASVPGTFAYAPASGTRLPLGASQALAVTFSPADSVDYTEVRTSVSINVVPLFGDLNANGSVGCDDLAIIKASFGKKTGQAGFDPRADVNNDGVVNILDLSAVARVVPVGTVCK